MSAFSVNYAYFRGTDLHSACPAQGGASMWAEAQRTRLAEVVALHGDAVSTVWQIACTLQKVQCARKAVGEGEVRCT
jgi:hypothetical protein